MRGDASAFGTERVFGDLDKNLFTPGNLFFQRNAPCRRAFWRLVKFHLIPGGANQRYVLWFYGKIRGMEKAGFVHPYIHKGGLHSG
jgi:hypothetical protein